MDRTAQIIQILAQCSVPITLAKMAESIGVSPRTIRYDLEAVENLAAKVGMTLVKKAGVGIQMEGSQERRRMLLALCKSLEDKIEPFSPEDRKYLILEKILTSRTLTTIDELSKVLFVSRTAVLKDLERAEAWLKLYHLELYRKPNHGVGVVGEEDEFRNALAVLAMAKKRMDFESGVGPTDFKRLAADSVDKLQKLLPLDYRVLEDIVLNAEKQLGLRFAEDAFLNLIIHISIAMRRTEAGKAIALAEDYYEHLKEKEAYATAFWIGERLTGSYGIVIPHGEVLYIALHILDSMKQSDALQHEKNLKDDEDLLEDENNRMASIIADEIASIASHVFSMPLQEDQAFINGLKQHLRPTLHRLKYGLKLKNPIMEEIKINHGDVLDAAWMASPVFERYIDQKINEDEVGYIALHIGAAVERNRTMKLAFK